MTLDVDDAADTADVVTPDADEAEETTSEETVASEDEDTQTDDSADTEDEDTEDTADVSAAPAKGSSAKLDKLLGKYGGDPDKMVDAYFEQANSMSRLAKKLEEIEGKLVAKQADPEEEQKYLAADPDVKEYAGELASLDSDIKEIQQSQTSMVSEYGKLEKLEARLEGELAKAPFEEKAEVKEKLDDARSQMRELNRKWESSKTELRRLQNDIRRAARGYRQAEAEAKLRRGREKQQELESVQGQRLTQQEFATTIRAEASQYGLDPSSKTYQIVQQAVKDRIVSFLRTLPPNAPGINMPDAVKKLMAEYAEALELKQRFAQKSKAKVALLTPRPGEAKHEGSVSKSPTPKDAAYWKQRAARIAAG